MYNEFLTSIFLNHINYMTDDLYIIFDKLLIIVIENRFYFKYEFYRHKFLYLNKSI